MDKIEEFLLTQDGRGYADMTFEENVEATKDVLQAMLTAPVLYGAVDRLDIRVTRSPSGNAVFATTVLDQTVVHTDLREFIRAINITTGMGEEVHGR